MLPYFPFQQQFNERPGTLLVKTEDALIEVDEHYESELALKQSLLNEAPNHYFQAQPGFELAQWDALQTVLTDLVTRQPDQFSLQRSGDNWHWENHRLGTRQLFTVGDPESLLLAPLNWVGRQVQEDLLLLDGPDATLVAGQLCFGNAWSLDEKLGLPFAAIHAPINSIMPSMMQAAQTIVARLPVGKPLWRLNWSLKLNDQLDLTNRRQPALQAQTNQLLPLLTADNAGENVWIRVERQMLTRLPRSGAILFTIRTYRNRLTDECRARPDAASRLLATLQTTPPAMLDYKGVTPFLAPTLGWLQAQQ